MQPLWSQEKSPSLSPLRLGCVFPHPPCCNQSFAPSGPSQATLRVPTSSHLHLLQKLPQGRNLILVKGAAPSFLKFHLC